MISPAKELTMPNLDLIRFVVVAVGVTALSFSTRAMAAQVISCNDSGQNCLYVVNSSSGGGMTVSTNGTGYTAAGVFSQSPWGNGVWGDGKTGGRFTGHDGILAEGGYGGTAIVADGFSPGAAAWLDGDVFVANGTFYNWSDARFKKEIQDFSTALDQVLKLRPVTFKWNGAVQATPNPKPKGDDGRTHFGLIAQEVERVLPDLIKHGHGVADSGADVLMVNYIELIPALIGAVQKQNETIRLQESRIAALERAASTPKGASLGYGAALGLVPIGLLVSKSWRRQRRESRRKA
jgi:hypothetical protein